MQPINADQNTKLATDSALAEQPLKKIQYQICYSRCTWPRFDGDSIVEIVENIVRNKRVLETFRVGNAAGYQLCGVAVSKGVTKYAYDFGKKTDEGYERIIKIYARGAQLVAQEETGELNEVVEYTIHLWRGIDDAPEDEYVWRSNGCGKLVASLVTDGHGGLDVVALKATPAPSKQSKPISDNPMYTLGMLCRHLWPVGQPIPNRIIQLIGTNPAKALGLISRMPECRKNIQEDNQRMAEIIVRFPADLSADPRSSRDATGYLHPSKLGPFWLGYYTYTVVNQDMTVTV